jgi:amino acid transporter
MGVVGGTDAVVGGAGGSGHEHEHKLDSTALHWFDSIVMAVAGSAPAYSISVSTGVIVAAVGFASPASLLWCGIPMLGIAIAYHQLNKLGANAGAAYAWVGRVIHPYLGFMAGWAVVISATIFMVEGSLPAGQATLSLFSEHAASMKGWYTLVGAVWFLVMAFFVARGARVTANAQWVMSSIEILLLVLFIILGFTHGHKVHSFSFSWLWFSHFGSAGKFATGALVAAFYYWGWDVSSNLGEETEDGADVSGAGGIIGVIVCFVLFELFTIVMNMDLSQSAMINQTGANLQGLGQLVGNSFCAKLAIIALMLSTIATLETTLIQVTRSLFSMSREVTLPPAFGRLHSEWNTPVFATCVIVAISLVLFIASNFAGGIGKILSDGEYAIDIQICIYYALAGFAAVIGFHRYALKSAKNLLLMFLFPLLGGGFMLYVLIEALTSGALSSIEIILGFGGMALGIIPIIYYSLKGSAYLHAKPTLGRTRIEDELPTFGAL